MKSPVNWLLALVVILVGALGYLLGRGGLNFNNTLTASPTPLSTPLSSSSSVTPSPIPSPISSPSPSPAPQQVSAGGILSFPKYLITIPPNWEYAKTSTGASDQRLTLTKGEYKIIIQEGAFGGMMCLYAGDPPFDGPSQTYSSYVELATIDGLKLRRSSTSDPGFTVCQYASGSWQAPTPFGHIAVMTPSSPLLSDLAEVDNILRSLHKD